MATSLKIDDDLKGRIKQLAEAKDRSAHWIMREAITQYVEREEWRQSFYQEAMDSWEEFQRTGLHITGEEISAWLNDPIPMRRCLNATPDPYSERGPGLG